MKIVQAPGKAMLFGEYAVLEGAPAIITAVDRWATASLVPGPSAEPLTPFVAGALAAAATWLRERDLLLPDGVPRVDSRDLHADAVTPDGRARKLGLGSSAAVTVATFGAVLARAGVPLDEKEAIHAACEAAHAAAQGGRGSGADVAAAVWGGSIRYLRHGRSAQVSLVTLGPLEITFVDTGVSASTAERLDRLAILREREPERYRSALRPLADLSAAVAGEVDLGWGIPLQAVREWNRALDGLAEAIGLSIVTEPHRRIAEIAASVGGAAKPSGAGGGDLAVCFTPQGSAARLRAALEGAGFATLALTVGASGLALIGAAAEPVRQPGPGIRVSRVPGFYKLSIEERRRKLAEHTGLVDELRRLEGGPLLDIETADHMIENAIGVHALPLGVGLNFRMNDRDYLVPMAVEEPSVVAAASNAARMVRAGGGFLADADDPIMISQVQLTAVSDTEHAKKRIEAHTSEIILLADAAQPNLVARGGGTRGIEVRVLEPSSERGAGMLVVHLHVDCRDAMGANLVNTIAEAVADRLAALAGGQVGLRILSNLADRRCVRVRCRIPVSALSTGELDGEGVADAIHSASRFAELDPYRAATHNKGIMNGIDAVVIACGNDWRGIEAGAHAFAARSGVYRPLAVWRHVKRNGEPVLEGEMEVPMALGTVGGATRVHPGARFALGMIGAETAAELGMIIACVGMASNLAALRALATEGIQRGHMTLHARTVALAAGASGELVERVAGELARLGEIRIDRATTILARLRSELARPATTGGSQGKN